MPPSQLKQLKASLREHGVLGPQKSKKQRKQNAKDSQKRVERNAALEKIREQFNPFEVKTQARRPKYDVVSNKESKTLVGRPGVTRGLGEERRRQTLLRELQNRNKVGGLVDRRFGEDDPTLTPEQKAAERYARQNERKMRKSSLFNLEMDSGDEMVLTHGGRSLDFDGEGPRDDYNDDDNDDEPDLADDRPTERVRLDQDEAEDEDEAEGGGGPRLRKSKKEVMKEVIAKSKQHKADRQAAKEDDEDLRLELDKGMSELYQAIHSHKPPEKALPSPPIENEPHMDPARAAMLAGKSREDAEKEYEANLRQLKLDARSQPSFRTKTEDEKAAEEAEKLKELERKRIRRMKGDAESSDDDEEEEPQKESDPDKDVEDDAEAFGLRQPEPAEKPRELDVEDEDEFVLDDLVASESEPDAASDEDLDSDQDSSEPEDDGDDDFINGLVLPRALPSVVEKPKQEKQPANTNLAYTYPCPQSHAEFLELVKDKSDADLSTIVQRIRALYHKGLAQENSAKLARFAQVLHEHIYYRAQHVGLAKGNGEFDATEALIRHLHSMAKAQPLEIGNAFRSHLSTISEERPLQLNTGDCIVLTAIATIFPTSDHFHSVVTPATLTIARYLGQSSVQNLHDLGIGAYCCTLAMQYQSFSSRYVPEVINYIVNAIAILAPKPLPTSLQLESGETQPLNVPLRVPDTPLRIVNSRKAPNVTDKVSFRSLVEPDARGPKQALTLLHLFIRLGSIASTLWPSKTAYPELIAPVIHAIRHLTTLDTHLPAASVTLATTTLSELESRVSASLASRRPLLLHNHRPLPIPTSYPLFIDNYNPDRRYDPDRERAELSKLRAEHKKERKGAMRELRKDANFIAREKLREKKERDEAYEKKFKRLVAEIQGEEGREAKEYEREKKKRKGRF